MGCGSAMRSNKNEAELEVGLFLYNDYKFDFISVTGYCHRRYCGDKMAYFYLIGIFAHATNHA